MTSRTTKTATTTRAKRLGREATPPIVDLPDLGDTDDVLDRTTKAIAGA